MCPSILGLSIKISLPVQKAIHLNVECVAKGVKAVQILITTLSNVHETPSAQSLRKQTRKTQTMTFAGEGQDALSSGLEIATISTQCVDKEGGRSRSHVGGVQGAPSWQQEHAISSIPGYECSSQGDDKEAGGRPRELKEAGRRTREPEEAVRSIMIESNPL